MADISAQCVYLCMEIHFGTNIAWHTTDHALAKPCAWVVDRQPHESISCRSSFFFMEACDVLPAHEIQLLPGRLSTLDGCFTLSEGCEKWSVHAIVCMIFSL